MKAKIALLLALITCLVFVASADAFRWHMRYGQAKNASRDYIQGLCRELGPDCDGYGVGQCRRKTVSRFDCTVATFSETTEPGEEIECDIVLHWGVSHQGYMQLKNSGEPHCYFI